MVTFAFRPVVAFQPNSPSCGNQPANISLTARRLDTPTKDKHATRKRTGPVSRHPAGRPAHPCPLDKPAYISGLPLVTWRHRLKEVAVTEVRRKFDEDFKH